MTHSGVIHFIAEDDRHAVALCQKLLSFLPSNNLEDPPQVEGDRTSIPTRRWTTSSPPTARRATTSAR